MDLGPVVPAGAGISMARLAANLTALACPRAHTAAVPVDELLTGVTVAWLCPDCDKQLPADWRPAPIDVARVATHQHDHHGSCDFHLTGCPLCNQETGS